MWICKLIGHKYVRSGGGYERVREWCWRCGERVGEGAEAPSQDKGTATKENQ